MRFISCRPQGSEVLNRFFDDQVLSKLLAENQWSIDLDIIEEQDQYILKADLPGVKKEDIKVSLEDNVLSIQAERKSEAVTQERQVHRIERTYGRYQRSLNLGANVDASKIKANYKDGVLELSVPKAEEVKPKTVDIQVS
jgi:HSP20 family protein